MEYHVLALSHAVPSQYGTVQYNRSPNYNKQSELPVLFPRTNRCPLKFSLSFCNKTCAPRDLHAASFPLANYTPRATAQQNKSMLTRTGCFAIFFMIIQPSIKIEYKPLSFAIAVSFCSSKV